MATKTEVWVGAVALALGLAGATPASATTLDFTGITDDQGTSLVLSNATINAVNGTVFVGAAGESDGFCFFLSNVCIGNGEILFDNPISNLTFDIDGADRGDSVEITAFNGGSNLGSVIATTNGQLDFSSFGTLTSLFFDDNSTPNSAGVGYSTFQFDEQQQTAIPVPASLPLILGAPADEPQEAGAACAVEQRPPGMTHVGRGASPSLGSQGGPFQSMSENLHSPDEDGFRLQ